MLITTRRVTGIANRKGEVNMAESIKEMAETIKWSHDFDSAAKAAQQAGKPILLDFSAAPM
jgi:hypothetical protein